MRERERERERVLLLLLLIIIVIIIITSVFFFTIILFSLPVRAVALDIAIRALLSYGLPVLATLQ